jgi:hypothetical protein
VKTLYNEAKHANKHDNLTPEKILRECWTAVCIYSTSELQSCYGITTLYHKMSFVTDQSKQWMVYGSLPYSYYYVYGYVEYRSVDIEKPFY